MAGNEVQVLAPDVHGYGAGGLPELPNDVMVHRVFPGPLSGLIAWRQRRRLRKRKSNKHDYVNNLSAVSVAEDRWHVERAQNKQSHQVQVLTYSELNWKGKIRHLLLYVLDLLTKSLTALIFMPIIFINFSRKKIWGVGLNWKGQFFELLKSGLSVVMFPDYRSEWMPWVKHRFKKVISDFQPDYVITSHEPANSIELGFIAKRMGFNWIADLGDPILAPYTAKRWRKRAFNLESKVCALADLITVSSNSTKAVLSNRHDVLGDKFLVITQGYDHRFKVGNESPDCIEFDTTIIELLYTGSFYKFRCPSKLISAVSSVDGVRLNVATIVVPHELDNAAKKSPNKFRMLGFLPHNHALQIQRRCDVLINIGNDDPVQIPGKLYEYLGAKTSILHIFKSPEDQISNLITAANAGWCVADSTEDILECLVAIQNKKRAGQKLFVSKDNAIDVREYCWEYQAAKILNWSSRNLIDSPSQKSG